MSYANPQVVRGIYGELVREFGGGEAAAALLGVSKATVSKQLAGHAEIAFVHVAKIEDAVGRMPLTDMLQDRRVKTIGESETERLMGIVAREVGDIPAAVMRFYAAGDRDSMRKEGRELASALEALLTHLDSVE